MLVVVSPCFAMIIKMNRWVSWVLVVVSFVLYYALRDIYDQVPLGVFYFVLGMHLRCYGEAIIKSRKLWPIVFVGAWMLAVHGVAFVVGVLLTMMGVFSIVGPWPIPKVLTQNSFAIYLLHGIILYAIHRVIAEPGIAGHFAIGALTIALSVFVAESMRRFTPCIGTLLLGGR